MTFNGPAVYVGTYHKYNCGSIFGKWFDLTDFEEKDEFHEACRDLHASEDDPDFMFQDWGKRIVQTVFHFFPCFLPWTLSRTWTLPWTETRPTPTGPGSSQL